MSEENSKVLNRSLDLLIGVREIREKYLSALQELQKTRLTLLQSEVKRLRRNTQLGADEDPRMKIFEGSIRGANRIINSVTAQLEIAKIIVPRVKEGEALVHGRITDENRHGIRNCEISLIVGGDALNVMGKSDDSGYYSIILPFILS